jgi:tRNA (guanine-N7-)-methyltransferase
MKRLIKSFVRRQGRITTKQKKALTEYSATYILNVSDRIIEPATLFLRDAPLNLEIGFGMGQSLVTMAMQHPEQNYIGIEVHSPGVGSMLAALEENKINNVRVYSADAVEVLKNCISNESIQAIYIFFPDPWPKKRHHKRRLIQPEFIDLLYSKLKRNGFIHLATDWEEYAQHMLDVLSKAPGLENTAGKNLFYPRPADRPLTKFEIRGQKLGHGVWDLIFSKI